LAVWSGDAVVRDEEGFRYFVGRKDEMIKISGCRVSPTEVEGAAYTRETSDEWAEGSTLLISAQCLRRTGPWDASYFLCTEKTDFALRACDAGFVTVFTPRARAVHLQGGSAQSPSHWTLVVANEQRFYRRRHGRVASAPSLSLLAARGGSRALVGRTTLPGHHTGGPGVEETLSAASAGPEGGAR
jgi:GT2 family glycosyltransferase